MILSMAKFKLPENIRKKFVEAGRRGGLAGSRADKIKAAKACAVVRKNKSKKNHESTEPKQ